ncbi:MAG: ATP-binding cassette domain-containing protein [Acidobacteria bacterium]|nr:ATP-binding cassette domain-containing protein [Acidobacteriota bacterium]
MMLLDARELYKSFGRTAVLQNLSVGVDRGETLGIIGPNGAGKTTLLRMLVGLVRGEGQVTLDGRPVRENLGRIGVAYFAGESTVPPLVRTRRWRRLFHEADAADNRPVRVLSRGTRQLLGLRTVFSLPALDLIVLDEPWEGLDPDAARWLSAAMRARRDGGAALVVSSHRLHDLAGVCNRYLFLEEGRATTLEASDLSPDGTATAEFLLAAFDELRGSRMFRVVT